MEEYESVDFASGSEDEKRLKKAKDSASRKRRQKELQGEDKRARIDAADSNAQLLRGT